MEDDGKIRKEQKTLAALHSEAHLRQYANWGSGSDSGVSKKAPPSFSEIFSQVMAEEAPQVLRLQLEELLSYPEYKKDADGNYVLMEVEREVKGAVGEHKTIKKWYRIPVRKIYPKLPEHMTNGELVGHLQLLTLMGRGGNFNTNFLAYLYERLEGRMAAVAELRKPAPQPGELSRRDQIKAALIDVGLQRAIDFHMPVPESLIGAIPGAREELGLPLEEDVVFPPTTIKPFVGRRENAPDIERIPLATEENNAQEPLVKMASTDKEDQ